MAKLIDAAAEALDALIAAAEKKAKVLGSWAAVNDPDIDTQHEVEKFASRKIANEQMLEEREEAFKGLLSKQSRRLLSEWKRLRKTPDMYDEEQILASQKAYFDSLTPEQRAEANMIGNLKYNVINDALNTIALDMASTFGDVDKIMRQLNAMVKAPVIAGHGTMQPAVEPVLQGVAEALEANGGVPPIMRFKLNNAGTKWMMYPTETADGLDLHTLPGILHNQVASQLADPSAWVSVNVREKGRNLGTACYLEVPQDQIYGLRFKVAEYILVQPEIAGDVRFEYKINGHSVSSGEYNEELTRREKKAGERAVDYSGMRQGRYFIGPKAEAMLQDWLGLRVHEIQQAPSRRAQG